MKKKISVVIPCRNQESKIAETIKHIRDTAKALKNFDVEIVFVNDRSSDNSEKEAEKALKGYNHFQILNTDKNYVGNGKGMAVELGMTKAKGDFRLFMDADNSTKFEQINKLVPYFEKYDIILGTRYSSKVVVPSGNWLRSLWQAVVDVFQVIIYGHALRYTAKRKQGRLREFVSRGANLAFTVLLGQSFTDSRCGFKMYSKEASEKIFPLCRIKTWDFDTEALVLAKRFNFKMIEVPVEWYDDAQASNFKIKDMINGFLAIFIIRWNLILGRYGKRKSGNKPLLILFLAGLIIAFSVFTYFLLDCRTQGNELKSYLVGRSETYVLKNHYCPNFYDLKTITINDVKNNKVRSNYEIVTPIKSDELEKAVKSQARSAGFFVSENNGETFYIYSVK